MSDTSTFNTKNKKILIIDDEPDLCELIEFQLQKEGYKTNSLSNPLEAIGYARDYDPHLIILDIMMPGLDGLHLCSMLKVDSLLNNIPILFLTACSDADEKIKGFERGADDYLTKPFDIRELLARVKVILTRTLMKKHALSYRLESGGIILDPESHEVFINDKLIDLTHTEFLLATFNDGIDWKVQTREPLTMFGIMTRILRLVQ